MSDWIKTIPGKSIIPRRRRRANPLPFEMSDGGRKAAGFDRERRDCSVRALAHAADIPYSEAHEVMRRAGRKHGKGGYTWKGLDLLVSDGKARVTKLSLLLSQLQGGGRFGVCSTVNQVMSALPKRIGARYLVVVRSHAFAIVDGVIKDTGPVGGKRRVTHLFEVTPIKREVFTREEMAAAWNRLINVEAKI